MLVADATAPPHTRALVAFTNAGDPPTVDVGLNSPVLAAYAEDRENTPTVTEGRSARAIFLKRGHHDHGEQLNFVMLLAPRHEGV